MCTAAKLHFLRHLAFNEKQEVQLCSGAHKRAERIEQPIPEIPNHRNLIYHAASVVRV